MTSGMRCCAFASKLPNQKLPFGGGAKRSDKGARIGRHHQALPGE